MRRWLPLVFFTMREGAQISALAVISVGASVTHRYLEQLGVEHAF
jgi:hypothetical protein